MSARNMNNLQDCLFQLKFTGKSLNRQAKKAQKDSEKEKIKVKKALAAGNTDGARIYAHNAIRKKNESLSLLKLSSRVDAVASRVETAVTMRSVTQNIGLTVRGMDRAMETMNLDQITQIMERFEQQFADLDVQTTYMDETISSTTAVSTPQDEVDSLMKRLAEEAEIEIEHEIDSKTLEDVPNLTPEKTRVEDDRLVEKLRALRPAA